mgnify:CR=1 FL=1
MTGNVSTLSELLQVWFEQKKDEPFALDELADLMADAKSIVEEQTLERIFKILENQKVQPLGAWDIYMEAVREIIEEEF